MRWLSWSFRAVNLAICGALALSGYVRAAQDPMIIGTDAAGVSRLLALNRVPGLYTGNFGDCLGGQSLFNITKFDAAFYADNMTVLFHIDGSTNIKNESLMMYISVNAYGESRFAMTVNPCFLNIYSLCPMFASQPITGWATIPVGPAQVGGIPPIALSLPDFEGYAKIQIFANSTQTEIGCFQAVMTNGNSFAQPAALSPVFAFFAAVAVISSFATAAYGVSVPHMRTHFAHSMSVFVVFETFQSFFLSGALSLQWPSVLVSWWSNFAWACGLIPSSSLVGGINHFAGVRGNGSQVGGASSAVIDTDGGLATQIYGRSNVGSDWVKQAARPTLLGRAAYNASNPYDYTWAGVPVSPGLPLPGTWNGFPVALSVIGIPVQDAFLVALVWFAVAMTLLVAVILAFKGSLELLARRTWIKDDRLAYFRAHYVDYLRSAVLRTVLIAFFAMTTLSLIQVAMKGSPTGPTAIAAIVLLLFVLGLGSVVAYAAYVHLHSGRYAVASDRIVFVRRKMLKYVPVIVATRNSTLRRRQETTLAPIGSLPFFRIQFIDSIPDRTSVHQDSAYIRRFGWLSARYRRTRWWFFSYYFLYLLVKALFIGGAGSSPTAQVFGLFVVEMIAFVVTVQLNPYEGARNTAMAVWLLGISKVVTAGLSIAFLPAFKVDRIITTVFGVVIIVVQGFAVIALAILICLGAVSSYMSLTRNREEFWPENLEHFRVQFFEKMQARAPDKFVPPKPKPAKKSVEDEPREPQEPYFSVNSVHRAPKIEDEDGDVVAEMEAPHNASVAALHLHQHPDRTSRASRPNSTSSRYSVGSLPRGARPHRPSWSSKDFAAWEGQMDRPDSALAHRLSSSSMNVLAAAGAAAGAAPSGSRNTPKPLAPIVIPAAAGAEREKTNSGAGTPTSPQPPPGSPLSPLSPGRVATPTRETLARHTDERVAQHPPPPIEEAEKDA